MKNNQAPKARSLPDWGKAPQAPAQTGVLQGIVRKYRITNDEFRRIFSASAVRYSLFDIRYSHASQEVRLDLRVLGIFPGWHGTEPAALRLLIDWSLTWRNCWAPVHCRG
jgi:hypothetical protein